MKLNAELEEMLDRGEIDRTRLKNLIQIEMMTKVAEVRKAGLRARFGHYQILLVVAVVAILELLTTYLYEYVWRLPEWSNDIIPAVFIACWMVLFVILVAMEGIDEQAARIKRCTELNILILLSSLMVIGATLLTYGETITYHLSWYESESIDKEFWVLSFTDRWQCLPMLVAMQMAVATIAAYVYSMFRVWAEAWIERRAYRS